jgi:hypothetical protein
LIKGLMVTCCTLASIAITTSPPRWIIPKIGGFSFLWVPLPRTLTRVGFLQLGK